MKRIFIFLLTGVVVIGLSFQKEIKKEYNTFKIKRQGEVCLQKNIDAIWANPNAQVKFTMDIDGLILLKMTSPKDFNQTIENLKLGAPKVFEKQSPCYLNTIDELLEQK